MTTPVQVQLDDLAGRLGALEVEFAKIRPAAPAAPAAPAPAAASPRAAQPWPALEPVARRAVAEASPPPPPREPWIDLDSIDFAGLFGARALAIAGGVVTLLGIVFCFILAVDRGWIGPVARVGLGAAAATALFVAGLELRRRYGTTYASLASVGAGIAGGYATLLAATSLYHLLPTPLALGAACAIAAVGVATAIAWGSELVAALGLIGALLAPAALAAQGGITAVGTAFAALVLAATVIVALRKRWDGLLIAGIAASAPQIAALARQQQYEGTGSATAVVLTALFAALYLAAGIARQLRRGEPGLSRLATTLVFGAGTLAALGSYRLFGSEQAVGAALAAIALVYGCLAAAFMTRRGGRDLGSLLAAVAFAVGALALAGLLSGDPLAYTWAAEAAALALLARRANDIRFQLWSIVYAILAAGHVVRIDAPPHDLISWTEHPAAAAGAVFSVAAALAVVAWKAGPWTALRPGHGTFAAIDEALATSQQLIRAAASWTAGVATAYGLSLCMLALIPSFGWGHVAVAAIWSSAGLGLVIAGRRFGGTVWLGATTVLVFAEGSELAHTPQVWSYAIAGAVLLAAAVALDLRRDCARSIEPAAAAFALVSPLLLVAPVGLLDGRAGGLAVFGVAALYAALAAALFRREHERTLTTILWSIAAVLAAVAAAIVFHGTALVAAWALAAAGLAWLADQGGERRLLAASAGYATLAFVYTIARLAPPAHLFGFAAGRGGSGAVLLTAAAIAAFAAVSRRRGAWWTAGVVTLYGLSLAILDGARFIFGTAGDAAFRGGHTLVSALWGLLALSLLFLGLTKWRSLRIAGLALFAVSLGKLFLFDLSFLSSITRALSFLAVGAVLLAGGFFYQRLASTYSPEPADG